jgi:hypothetical protein
VVDLKSGNKIIMNLKTLKEKTEGFLIEHPQLSEEIKDLYYLALDEIEEGGSESHECELAYNDMLEVIKTIEMINDPSNDLRKEEERNWTQEQIQKEIDKKN